MERRLDDFAADLELRYFIQGRLLRIDVTVHASVHRFLPNGIRRSQANSSQIRALWDQG